MNDTITKQRYNRDDMSKTIEILRNGGVVLFPTELGWVLGCDATDSNALEKLMGFNHFFASKLPTLLIDVAVKLNSYLLDVPEMAWNLIEFSEVPLTIIFKGTRNLATQLSGDNQVAFRLVNGSFARDLCTRFRNPICTFDIEKNTDLLIALNKLVDLHVNYEDNEPVFLKSHKIMQLESGNLFKIIK